MKEFKILMIAMLLGFVGKTNAQKTIHVDNVTAASFYNVSYTIEFGDNWTNIANSNCFTINYTIKNLVVNSFTPRSKTYSSNDLAINHPNYKGGITFPIKINDDATKTIQPFFKVTSSNNNEAHQLSIGNQPSILTNCPTAASWDISQFKPTELNMSYLKTHWNVWSLQTEYGVSLGKLLSDLVRYKEN